MKKHLWMGAALLAAAIAPFAQAEDKAKAAAPAKAESPAKEEPVTGPAKPVPYPKGFRELKHVKSMLIYDKKHMLYDAFGGIHHIYVNDKAYKALKSKSNEYPTGAMFVFDLLEAPESGGAYTEGKRKFVAVMVRDPVKYKYSEGWGFQAWEGGDEKKPALKLAVDQKACSACHREVGAKGFVFSEWRD